MLLAFLNLVYPGALLPFHQDLDRAVWQLQELQDSGHAAHLEHVINGRFILGRCFLGHQHDSALGFHGKFQSLDALGPAHKQRDHHMRENHNVAQRQQRKIDRSGRKKSLCRHIKP